MEQESSAVEPGLPLLVACIAKELPVATVVLDERQTTIFLSLCGLLVTFESGAHQCSVHRDWTLIRTFDTEEAILSDLVNYLKDTIDKERARFLLPSLWPDRQQNCVDI